MIYLFMLPTLVVLIGVPVNLKVLSSHFNFNINVIDSKNKV